MALFDHSWYGRVLVDRVEKWVKRKDWEGAYAQINELERWLTDDGQVVVKFWFHISQKEQRRRLRKMEKDPAERWKVAKEDWRRNRRYDRWVEAAEDMLALTRHAGRALDGGRSDGRALDAGQGLPHPGGAMQAALDRRQQAPASVSRSSAACIRSTSVGRPTASTRVGGLDHRPGGGRGVA